MTDVVVPAVPALAVRHATMQVSAQQHAYPIVPVRTAAVMVAVDSVDNAVSVKNVVPKASVEQPVSHNATVRFAAMTDVVVNVANARKARHAAMAYAKAALQAAVM